ncbi:metal dependent phosphohydrolase [Flammeovirgaceae bacterium 311]|nr:metal dependent phosphohydrolase [Flammeovirgaceae bacterium 311]
MWQITEDYQWDTLRRRFNWVRDMQGVSQDPAFHAEGDVATHTRMAIEALQELDDFKDLPEQEQHILLAATLLHDVEKRSTTVKEADGRISSIGHAKKGELTSRSILYMDVPAPFPLREQIAKLVRHHGLPLWVFNSEDPRKAVIQASLEVDTHLLSVLAKADVLGRVYNDKEDLLYRIELFSELCREHNCYGKPREFVDAFSRFFYLQREEVAPDYHAYNDTKFRVILMSGLPGAGKDMYINFNLSDWPVISPDELRLEMKIKPNNKSGKGKVMQRAKEKAKEYMRSRTSFIWNSANITRLTRQPLIELFLSYGAYVKIIYVEVPFSMLQEQNRNRELAATPAAMVKMLGKMEVPAVTEAHEVEYIISEIPPTPEEETLPTTPPEEE